MMFVHLSIFLHMMDYSGTIDLYFDYIMIDLVPLIHCLVHNRYNTTNITCLETYSSSDFDDSIITTKGD